MQKIELMGTQAIVPTLMPMRAPARLERVPRPERSRAATCTAAMVASISARTGKTLLARVLTDYFLLSGSRPLVFDTDSAGHGLREAFPLDVVTVDLDTPHGQMILFDTLAARLDEPRVADISHDVSGTFFKLIEENDFIAEARSHRVEPVIFYIVDRNPDGYRQAAHIRECLPGCALVLVENAAVGRPKEITRESAAYQSFADHSLRMTLPRLDPDFAEMIEEGRLSLRDVISHPLSRAADSVPAGLTFEDYEILRRWILNIFREIHRVTRVQTIDQPMAPTVQM